MSSALSVHTPHQTSCGSWFVKCLVDCSRWHVICQVSRQHDEYLVPIGLTLLHNLPMIAPETIGHKYLHVLHAFDLSERC